MENIDEKINELSDRNRKKFNDTLGAVLEDESWLSRRKLPEDTSEKMIKIRLYGEMFEGDRSYFDS